MNQGSERNRQQRSKARQRANSGKAQATAARGRAGAVIKAEPLPALGAVVREIEAARQRLEPGPNGVRDFWRAQDTAHGKRPDFQLWRQLREAARFTGRLDGAIKLMDQALRSPDAQVRWAALALLSALPVEVRKGLETAIASALGSPEPQGWPKSMAWVRWLVSDGPEALNDLAALAKQDEDPGWKPGRALGLKCLREEGWMPMSGGVFRCWVASAIERQPNTSAAWLLTAWQMRRDARPPGTARRAGEASVLMDAAYAARRDGALGEAARYGAMAMHSLPMPNRMPEVMRKRLRPLAWWLAEVGMQVPAELEVRLDELPFPGEPAASEKGLEAAAEFADEADVSRKGLLEEVELDADWAVLRSGGAVLNHPLAALGWIGKKAGSLAVKKQHGLLEAATRLALKHDCLGSAGRMLAVWPGSAGKVLAYAQALRVSLRKMPLLRDVDVWNGHVANLREAWGRLEEGEAITDEESVFFLHETMMGRLETTSLCLPKNLRSAGDADEQRYDDIATVLEAEPRLLKVLEHQRVVELWEVTAMCRERADLEEVAWISLALRGGVEAGRYSVMMVTRGGRKIWQGRTKGGLQSELLLDEIQAALRELAATPITQVLLSMDPNIIEFLDEGVFAGAKVVKVPSWEAAFRALREGVLADLRND